LKLILNTVCKCNTVSKKDIRYRSLGPDLIPMYRQSARRWLYNSFTRR